MDQKSTAYRLNCKSKFRFYLRLLFNIINVALANSHNVYTKVGENHFLLDFKVVVANSLIGRYRIRFFPHLE